MKTTKLFSIFLALSLLVVSSCKDDTPSIAVTGVSLNKTTLSIKEGESSKLTATVTPNDATNKNHTWKSSDNSVATVSDGNVTAVKEGSAIITVTTEDGAKTATCEVTVTSSTVKVTGVTLNKEELTLLEGKSETLVATVSPINATNKEVEWESSDTDFVTVDDEGLVTAVKEGSATITVTSKDSGEKATCEVTVETIELKIVGTLPAD